MKCYEVTNCSQKNRDVCYVWKTFGNTPQDMDDIKCWVLKGASNEENKEQNKKCRQCKYYLLMNRETGIVSDCNAEVAVISGEGTINNERNTALEKAWQTLKRLNKNKILLDLSRVNNVYSSGLGTIITIHKDTQNASGLLVVLCPEGYVKNLFQVTKLSRILTIVVDKRQARDAFDALKQREAKKAAQAVVKEPVQQKAAPRQRPACHDYWKNKNPRNATTCDECFNKIKPSRQPCWIVVGAIEGISFQYVNEDCESCPYYGEFGAAGE